MDEIFSNDTVHIYRPQRSCGQGYVFTGVCDSVNRGGGCLPQCMLGCHTPPDENPPTWKTPPHGETPLRDGTPGMENPPPGGEPSPPAPGMENPPREADSSIRSTSGRYASYWNAFLFILLLSILTLFGCKIYCNFCSCYS